MKSSFCTRSPDISLALRNCLENFFLGVFREDLLLPEQKFAQGGGHGICRLLSSDFVPCSQIILLLEFRCRPMLQITLRLPNPRPGERQKFNQVCARLAFSLAVGPAIGSPDLRNQFYKLFPRWNFGSTLKYDTLGRLMVVAGLDKIRPVFVRIAENDIPASFPVHARKFALPVFAPRLTAHCSHWKG